LIGVTIKSRVDAREGWNVIILFNIRRVVDGDRDSPVLWGELQGVRNKVPNDLNERHVKRGRKVKKEKGQDR
jgi:hypothetical protein